jgi:hypothetical protein
VEEETMNVGEKGMLGWIGEGWSKARAVWEMVLNLSIV